MPAPLQTPRRFAWLLRLAPETAPVAAQLRHLLTEPDMTALLAAIPELRRTLRPLCRMLGIRQMLGIRKAPSPPAPPATPGEAASGDPVSGHAAASHAVTAQPPPPIPPPATLAFLPRRLLPMPA